MYKVSRHAAETHGRARLGGQTSIFALGHAWTWKLWRLPRFQCTFGEKTLGRIEISKRKPIIILRGRGKEIPQILFSLVFYNSCIPEAINICSEQSTSLVIMASIMYGFIMNKLTICSNGKCDAIWNLYSPCVPWKDNQVHVKLVTYPLTMEVNIMKPLLTGVI